MLHTEPHKAEISTTFGYKSSTPGKLPNSYHHFTFTNQSAATVNTIKNTVKNPENLLVKNHFLTKTNITHRSSNLLYKARLQAQKGGGDKSTNSKTHQNTCKICAQQMSSRGKAVHDAIMRSPIDTNMEDIEDTVVIEATQNKRSQETKKGSSSSKRKKNGELITGLKDTPRDFWLGIVAMEKLAIDEGVKTKDCRPSMKKEDLVARGIPEREAEEMSQLYKIAFPHVQQLLYPLERPDGKGGQHFNLTQLPIETEVDPGTGLSLDYHIAVFFERPSTDYTHNEILIMATTRLACMNIEMGIGLAEPIYIPCKEKEKNSKIKFWTGTIKIHLKNLKLMASTC